ncbi:hypothetical protein FRC19_011519 [Serendipita sp. 401]|nr:hypothetical protein FRC19_011519 [Serendipita sp. 401]
MSRKNPPGWGSSLYGGGQPMVVDDTSTTGPSEETGTPEWVPRRGRTGEREEILFGEDSEKVWVCGDPAVGVWHRRIECKTCEIFRDHLEDNLRTKEPTLMKAKKEQREWWLDTWLEDASIHYFYDRRWPNRRAYEKGMETRVEQLKEENKTLLEEMESLKKRLASSEEECRMLLGSKEEQLKAQLLKSIGMTSSAHASAMTNESTSTRAKPLRWTPSPPPEKLRWGDEPMADDFPRLPVLPREPRARAPPTVAPPIYPRGIPHIQLTEADSHAEPSTRGQQSEVPTSTKMAPRFRKSKRSQLATPAVFTNPELPMPLGPLGQPAPRGGWWSNLLREMTGSTTREKLDSLDAMYWDPRRHSLAEELRGLRTMFVPLGPEQREWLARYGNRRTSEQTWFDNRAEKPDGVRFVDERFNTEDVEFFHRLQTIFGGQFARRGIEMLSRVCDVGQWPEDGSQTSGPIDKLCPQELKEDVERMREFLIQKCLWTKSLVQRIAWPYLDRALAERRTRKSAIEERRSRMEDVPRRIQKRPWGPGPNTLAGAMMRLETSDYKRRKTMMGTAGPTSSNIRTLSSYGSNAQPPVGEPTSSDNQLAAGMAAIDIDQPRAGETTEQANDGEPENHDDANMADADASGDDDPGLEHQVNWGEGDPPQSSTNNDVDVYPRPQH